MSEAQRKRAAHLRRQAVFRAREKPGEVLNDVSTWSLAAANIVALVVAIAAGWQLTDLMLVYWVQSIIIGVSYFARMLSLEKFSTENFKINDRAVEPTRETKLKTALFFSVHYGVFHAAYLGFILSSGAADPLFDPWLWICGVTFAVNHLYSYRYNRDLDRAGTPNIGTLMFTPYLRIIPMHVTIIFGSMAPASFGLLLFGGLKTVADIAMHHVEHRKLGKRKDGG